MTVGGGTTPPQGAGDSTRRGWWRRRIATTEGLARGDRVYGIQGERGAAALLSPGAQCDVATHHVRWANTYRKYTSRNTENAKRRDATRRFIPPYSAAFSFFRASLRVTRTLGIVTVSAILIVLVVAAHHARIPRHRPVCHLRRATSDSDRIHALSSDSREG